MRTGMLAAEAAFEKSFCVSDYWQLKKEESFQSLCYVVKTLSSVYRTQVTITLVLAGNAR
jgi:hypothetical protein